MMCSCITLLHKSRISCSFFHNDFFSLSGFFTVLINTNWELKIRNHPFHLLLTCNLAFSLFFFFLIFRYLSERAESNEKFFSRNQEVILSASLVGFCLIVIVGVRLPYTVSIEMSLATILTTRKPYKCVML